MSLDTPTRLLSDLRRLLRLHRDFGIEAYPRSPELANFLAAPPPTPPVSPPACAAPAPKAKAEAVPEKRTAPSHQTLAEIQAELGDCRRCPLHGNRQRIIFGTGNPKAALFIVGDAPHQEDEVAGAPFSGEAGELLAKMLKAIGLQLSDVYLTTVVKCRTVNNQAPQPGQIAACLPFLLRQIDAVAPKVICTMGTLAAQTLLRDTAPLIRLRGNFHDCQGRPLMPTFHPAFLLKNPELKKATWIDLQLIQAKLGAGRSGA